MRYTRQSLKESHTKVWQINNILPKPEATRRRAKIIAAGGLIGD